MNITMKKGDIIVCLIEDSNKTITKGKEYQLIEEVDDAKVAIINDQNKRNTYYASRFKR